MTLIAAIPVTVLITLLMVILYSGIYTLIDELTELAERRIWLNREIKRLQHIYDTAEDDMERIVALAMLWNCRYERGDE